MTEPRAFYAFRAIFAAYIVYASAVTAVGQLQQHGPGGPIFLLASIEILAALLLLLRRTQLIAAILLLAIFAIAFVLETVGGEVPIRFIYYSATAALIVYLDRNVRPQLATPASA